MGIAVTVICTVPGWTYTIAEYLPNSNAALGYTGIVNGASCAFRLTNADSGDFEQIFNTTSGLPIVEGINCTVPTDGSNTCTTSYITFSGAAYAAETIEIEQFYNGDAKGFLNGTANWTYIALPPVPSQTPQPTIVNNGFSIFLNTSQWSQDYGYGLIGCVVSAGKSPYSGSLAPATLSSNAAQNSIPTGAVAIYASPPTINQSSTVLVPLTSLFVAPNSLYDFHWVCYNSVGRSPDTILYNISTSSALPIPGTVTQSTGTSNPSAGDSSSSSSSSSSGLSNGAIAGIVIGTVIGALICLILGFLLGGGRGGGKKASYEGGERANTSQMPKHTSLEDTNDNVEMH